METRRQFLKKAAVLSGAVGASGTLVESIRRAAAIEPTPGSSFLDAEHVVILMQENRSFDHCFGALQGVRGFNDPRAITLPNANPVWVQTNAAGQSYVPFRLNLMGSSSTWMGCLPHGRTDQVDARNDGRYDRWLEAKASGEEHYAHMPLTLGFYNREDIPFYYAMADAFTVCDQHFCSVLSSTTPNRLHLWSGTLRPQSSADAWPHITNADCDTGAEVSWTTFPERLEDHGVSWKIYQNELWLGVGLNSEEDAWLGNFGDNPIEYFTQFKVRFAKTRRELIEQQCRVLSGQIAELKRRAGADGISERDARRLAEEIAEKSARLAQAEAERREYNDETFQRLSPREKSLHARAFCTNTGDPHYRELAEISYRDGDAERRVKVPRGDLFHQFRQDVQRGELPSVSWVVAPQQFSDHPCSAWFGAWYIAELLDILTRNPDVWKKTIFILTYDENDGYFDHVPPFVAPHPQRPDTGRVSKGIDLGVEYVLAEQERTRKPPGEVREAPVGLGYRVPMIVASPWSRGGCVCSQVLDHTSPLQLLEKWLTHKTGREIRETNISQWRRTVCGDLTSAFQPADVAPISPLPYTQRDAYVEAIHRAQFKELPDGYHALTAAELEQIRRDPLASKWLPRQEPGVRRSCPLPYELAVDGRLADDRRKFELALAAGNEAFGARAAGAPFVVYARRKPGDVQTRDYAVAAGDRVTDSWSLADFDDGRYWLLVYGPNGFFREFRGDGEDPRVEIRLRYERVAGESRRLSSRIELVLINRDDRRNATVEVADLSYRSGDHQRTVAPGSREICTIDTRRSFGWYDLGVRIDGNALLEQRYAGRVETGAWSYSDPAMGQVVT